MLSINGAGTQGNPYLIRNAQDFNDMGDGINYNGSRNYYKLANNLYGVSSSAEFSGSLNGNGYQITTNGQLFSALKTSGYIGNVVIKASGSYSMLNTVENAVIEYCTIIPSNYAGGRISSIIGSKINNCAVLCGGAYTNYSGEIAGGFADRISDGSTVTNCYVRSVNLSGSTAAGGFAGSNTGSTITNCYVYGGTVTGSNAVGGFVGRNDNSGVITNCGTTAAAGDGSYSGAFVGMNYASVSSSFADNSSGLEFAAVNDGASDNNSVSSEGAAIPATYINTGGRDVNINDTTIYTPTASNTAAAQGGLSDISGHWAEATIQNLVNQGVINGYEDGTFRPEDSVTKGEYIKLLMSATGYEVSTEFAQFSDVNSSWAKGYVTRALELGICDNVNSGDTVFGVDESITRAEASALMGRLLAPETSGTTSFTDTDSIPDWAQNPVYACVQLGLIAGNDDGSFKPNNNLTRAEAATIIERIMNLPQRIILPQ